MAQFASDTWFAELKERVNRLEKFNQAARWFEGRVGWTVDDNSHVLNIAKGQVKAVEAGRGKTDFAMAGDMAAWQELLQKGTINRMFRQNKIAIEGDRVAAMRFWKVLWHLTETARNL
jgi:ubiquinone biosynthesis protein UbiJ